MFSQKNSEASSEAQAGRSPEGCVLGERAAGLQGYPDLPFIPSLPFPQKRRPGPSATDSGDRRGTGSVRISADPCPASTRGLARQP